jgi:hypothetical protein
MKLEKIKYVTATLILLTGAIVLPVEATLISAGTDIAYRFNTGSNGSDNYQINFSFDTPLPSGDGFLIDFGTTLGGTALGSKLFTNFFNSPVTGFVQAGGFPDLPPGRYTYLTVRYTGDEVDLGGLQLGVRNNNEFQLIDGIEYITPSAYVSRPAPESSNLGASVITSFRNYVEGSQNTEKTYLERLNECAALGSECDFDATANDQEFRQNLQNAADAAYASKDLVTRTSLLPQNQLELVADAPTLLDEIKAFFQWIGVLPENENRDEIVNVEVAGETGQFTVNPTFNSYLLTYYMDFEGDSFFSDLIGESFLFNNAIGGGGFYAGLGFVESVETLDNGAQRAVFSISQLESNNAFPTVVYAVPEPGSLPLLALGLAFLFSVRKQYVKRR